MGEGAFYFLVPVPVEEDRAIDVLAKSWGVLATPGRCARGGRFLPTWERFCPPSCHALHETIERACLPVQLSFRWPVLRPPSESGVSCLPLISG